MNAKIARYWRQVRSVQAMTGASSKDARRAVALLREERGWTTAAEIKRHPIIVSRAATATLAPPSDEPPRGKPYKDLNDWIESWEAYDGEYDYYEIETNADY